MFEGFGANRTGNILYKFLSGAKKLLFSCFGILPRPPPPPPGWVG
jgi:hypothetical protein